MGDLISLLLLLALIFVIKFTEAAAGKLAEKIFLTKKRKQLKRK
jgi:hypothetical protein